MYPLLKPQGVTINPAYPSTDGKIWLQLKSLSAKPVFGDLSARRALLGRFASVDGSNMTDADLDGWPALSFAKIAADPQGKEKVTSALTWMVEQVKAAGSA